MPLLSVFRNLFGQRELIKYKEVLTFHFLCPCGLCSRPHQPKIKTRCHKCFLGEPPHKRYLEPDIVLTRNERGLGGLGTADGHSWRSSLSAHTFAIFLTESCSPRPGKPLHGRSLQLLVVVKSRNSFQNSFPGLLHLGNKTSQA